jgi:hypothetical protein
MKLQTILSVPGELQRNLLWTQRKYGTASAKSRRSGECDAWRLAFIDATYASLGLGERKSMATLSRDSYPIGRAVLTVRPIKSDTSRIYIRCVADTGVAIAIRPEIFVETVSIEDDPQRVASRLSGKLRSLAGLPPA